jgi:hypothetical protein
MSERLSDAELESLLVDNNPNHPNRPDAYALASEVTALVHEIKERRAADLPAEEVAALRWIRAVAMDHCGPGKDSATVARLIDKLIAAAEARRG